MLIDVHCHVYRMETETDRDRVIRRAKDADVCMINCCHNSSNSYEVDKVMELAEKNDNVFTSLGLYYFGGERLERLKMSVTETVIKMAMDAIRSKAQERKIVAIGEVGLDYGMAKSSSEREIQVERFREFVNLSGEVDLPLIVHNTADAVDVILEILKERQRPAFLHGFRGTTEQAKEAISMGCLIGIWPTVIYFKYLQKLVKELPIESIAFETDSPFAFNAPVFAASGEPINIIHAAQKVAEIKDVSFEEVEEVTTRNAKQLFKLEI